LGGGRGRGEERERERGEGEKDRPSVLICHKYLSKEWEERRVERGRRSTRSNVNIEGNPVDHHVPVRISGHGFRVVEGTCHISVKIINDQATFGSEIFFRINGKNSEAEEKIGSGKKYPCAKKSNDVIFFNLGIVLLTSRN
jgi:hypothetical protein